MTIIELALLCQQFLLHRAAGGWHAAPAWAGRITRKPVREEAAVSQMLCGGLHRSSICSHLEGSRRLSQPMTWLMSSSSCCRKQRKGKAGMSHHENAFDRPSKRKNRGADATEMK